jgi:hypothetical protein
MGLFSIAKVTGRERRETKGESEASEPYKLVCFW